MTTELSKNNDLVVESEEAVCVCGDWQSDHENFQDKCHACNEVLQSFPPCEMFVYAGHEMRKNRIPNQG